MKLGSTGYESHPAADLFPMMGEVELSALADDIERNGLRDPIVLLDGMVLDGRNRLLACDMTTRDPRFERWSGEGSPTAWVLSKNLHRRHLSASQQALVVAEAKRLVESESPNLDSASVDSVARSAGVSRSSVFTAQQLLDKAVPELTKAVRDGEVRVSAAAAVASEPADVQRELVAAGPQAIREAAKEKRKGLPKLTPEERANVESLIAAGPNSDPQQEDPDDFSDARDRLLTLVKRIDDATQFATGAKALSLVSAARDAATAGDARRPEAEHRYSNLRASLFTISSDRKNNRR